MREITIAQRTIYLRGLLQRYGTLSLPLGSGLSFSLIQVFQPLRLRQSVVEKKKPHEHDSEATQRDTHENAEETDETKDREEALGELGRRWDRSPEQECAGAHGYPGWPWHGQNDRVQAPTLPSCATGIGGQRRASAHFSFATGSSSCGAVSGDLPRADRQWYGSGS
jgi:hypothetical protein